MIYEIECQDAAGNFRRVRARGATDEIACAAALKALNSWRAIRALPATAIPRSSAPTVSNVTSVSRGEKAPEIPKSAVPHTIRGRGPRMIHRATVVDQVEMSQSKPTGNVGKALLEALRAARAS